jgi:hypothetical protein
LAINVTNRTVRTVLRGPSTGRSRRSIISVVGLISYDIANARKVLLRLSKPDRVRLLLSRTIQCNVLPVGVKVSGTVQTRRVWPTLGSVAVDAEPP